MSSNRNATLGVSSFRFALVAGLALAGGLGAQPGFEGISVFATNSVWIKQNADVVSGSVVVNDASAGPTLVAGFELGVGLSATISAGSVLVADSIDVRSSAVVLGEVLCNEIDDATGVLDCDRAVSLPVFAQLPQFQSAPAGTTDVTVPIGGSSVLAPGSYRDVRVRQNATLVLTGGVYDLRHLDVGLAADLLVEAPTIVRIADKLEVSQNALVGSTVAAALAASDLVFYVAGVNGTTGALGAEPKAARLGLSADVHANVYAPNGTVWIRDGAVVTGGFLGRDVIVGLSAEVHLDSAFGNSAPSATPQDVFTSGPSPIVITLSGSDPDGDDLVFSIVASPTGGSLGPVVQAPAPFPGNPPGCNPDNDPLCDPPEPARTSATVEYTPATGDDLEDAFSFRVQDPDGASGVAVVRINPEGLDPGHEPPAGNDTVVASDREVETARELAVTIDLLGGAVCDGPCDGVGEAPFTDDVPLTFAIVPDTGPTGGSLGPVTQGGEVPRRSATVTFTPDPGFGGPDSFTYEACGTIASVLTCDTAVVSIVVAGELADDQTVSTVQDSAVDIVLLGTPGAGGGTGVRLERETSGSRSLVRRTVTPRRVGRNAAFQDPSEVAGNVADSDDDGLGDNHNDLPGPVPGVGAAGVDLTGGPGSNGVVRFQIEWDLADIGASPSALESAAVRLTTLKGTIDSLDTFFFVGSGPQDGLLTDSDFEAPAEQIPGVVMSVPADPVGTEGTFSFSVLGELRSALETDGLGHFSIQARVDEGLVGGGLARGLQIFTSADGNLPDFQLPVLEIATPGVATPEIQFTILTLPVHGTLFQFGIPITAEQLPAVLGSANLTYLPSFGFSGNDSFTFEATDFVNLDTGTVFLVVTPLFPDPCAANGREPGCEGE